MGRKITIRQSLVRNLTLLIVLTAGALVITTVVVGLQAVTRVSKSRIESRSKQTEEKLDQFFGAVRDLVRTGRGWAEAGLLDPTDHQAMNRLFVPVLEQSPYLSSMMVADSNGAEYLLLREPLEPDVWTNRVFQADAWGHRVFNRRWNTKTGEVEESFGELDYDPRKRVWYEGALRTTGDGVDWTRPVIFFVTKDPGITAGTHYTPPDGSGPTQVVAFDLLLMDIARFTTTLDVSANGKAFVLVEDEKDRVLRVVGLPKHERYASDADLRAALVFVPPEEAVADAVADLPLATDLGVEPLGAVVEAWTQAGRSSAPIRVKSGGETWWAGVREYPLGDNHFFIGVAVPAKDFLGDLVARSLQVALIALGALLIALYMAVRLARHYGQPLEALAKASHRIRQLDLGDSEGGGSRLAEISELETAQSQMVSTLRSFARYVPADVVRELVKRGEVAQIGGRTVDLTILFTDIEGFTAIAESLHPKVLTDHMAEYFGVMIDTLQETGATVDKLVGDAIVAFWGAPSPQLDHAERAVRSVLACRDRLADLNRGWIAEGKPPLPTRFGLATGSVVVGNIGAHNRLAYTVLGDVVNLASRLEGLNKVYGTHLLADHAVHDALGDAFTWRRLDKIVAMGRTAPAFVYEILGTTEETPPEVLDEARRYEEAWDAYAARDFEGAIGLLDALEASGGGSPAATRLRERCRRFLETPPPPEWDAVHRMTSK